MWTSLPGLLGLFPKSSVTLHFLFPDVAMGLHTRRTGLLSGLAVLSLFMLILPAVLLFLFCKRRQGRIFPEGKIWKCTFRLLGTEVIYPR